MKKLKEVFKYLGIFLLILLILPNLVFSITTYNANGLTGGTQRDLDYLSVSDLNNGDRGIVLTGTIFYLFKYDSTATDAENVATHPFKVRPDDYATAGVWIEQELATGAVDAAIIATDAVGSAEIIADAVGSAEIITDAIQADEIEAGAVGASEIATDAVGSAEIIADAVGTSELISDLEIKGWIFLRGVTTIEDYDSYNVSGITDQGVGDYLITWNTSFGSAEYAVCATSNMYHTTIGLTAGNVTIQTHDNTHTKADASSISVIALGDQ